MSAWIAKELGVDVPLHFSAFHPDYKMTDVPVTPPEISGAGAEYRSCRRTEVCLYRQRA